jgi:23S rRNA (adenine2503-C2)-methyltransferase
MPVNKEFPLEQLLNAVRTYTKVTGRKVTFEYILIDGVNDSPAQAAALAALVGGIACKVNLIPLNKIGRGAYKASPKATVDKFHAELLKRRVAVFTRGEKGGDIDAACGQLGIRMAEKGKDA